MRLTIVQYAGDYREAWERFKNGGKATYQAQRYSVSFVESLAQHLEQVSVICAVSEAPSDTMLPNGVRAIAAGLKPGFDPRDLIPHLEPTDPDRLVLVTPMIPLLRWAKGKGVRTLATLADSFRKRSARSFIRDRRLTHYLNHNNVDWVGNHGIAACLSLLRIGVRPDKIIPWDWPPSHKPSDYEPRQLSNSHPFALTYVGSVTEEKGVGDLVRALHLLRRQEITPTLTIIGNDPNGNILQLASQLEFGNQVRFAGLIPNEDIPSAMRAAHAVVIPSRHEYPEGLPLTIYEALAARTPIISSDHPMFRGALTHDQSALVFPAGDASALAAAISRLSLDSALYERLSLNSEEAWQALQLPVTWGDLVGKWLSDLPADRDWLNEHRLTSGLYDRQIAAREVRPGAPARTSGPRA